MRDPMPARPRRNDPWKTAVAHLRTVGPSWSDLIDRVGPCRLTPRPDRFGTLVRAIIGQQISSKAAASIDRRVRELAGSDHDPDRIAGLGEAGLRSCGLSGVKARYVLNVAEAVRSGLAPLGDFDNWEDQRILTNLTAIKGVGPWTAEMFLIFALNRPDVLSTGDLGLRVGFRKHFQLDELPTPRRCLELAEPLRPFRTIAMWYLWEEIDNPVRAAGSAEPDWP